METFNIYKKRDGQSFKDVGTIYASNFDEACKQFAKQMTEDNHNQSNNIVWLDDKRDGVNESGWYDFNGGSPVFDEDAEKYDADEAAAYLMVSEKAINQGFSSWNEDVYTWEVREPLDYIEINDMDEFENEKENYSFFMAVYGSRFFLYNGDFSDISIENDFGNYRDTDSDFMGCQISEIEFIETYLK
jgi:hypothetical protein